jgi:hypothetical protein
MAVTTDKPPSPWRAPLHVLNLFVLAAGIAVGVLGVVEANRSGEFARENLDAAYTSVVEGFGLPPQRGLWFAIWGALAALIGLVFEVLVFLRFRRVESRHAAK